MIGKNETRLARDLFAVNQRLSVICGGMKIDDAGNPIGPAALAQAFRQSVRELSADMRVKLIIYKLFDRYVLATLDELYQEINTELVHAGVLPQLRHTVRRGGPVPAPGGYAAQARSGDAPGETDTGESGESAAELLQTLHDLFQARRAYTGPAAPAVASHVPLPTANELIGALSVLQNQAAARSAPAPVHDPIGLTHEVLQLKEQLLTQLGALRGHRPEQVATIDEDAIDLVGMLFEFILEDRNLPAQMQVLLARLQIPYLKAAILDRKLFAHRQHPARRLLDGLAEAAKGWSAESDRDGRLLGTVKSIVDRLLQEFDDDLGIFERLRAELQRFQENAGRRAQLAEQRVAESTRGREKLEQARRRAAREIGLRTEGHTLPPLVHGVLTRAWANYLVLTLLRQGEESPEYQDALRFIDDFIVSTLPARDADARRALRQILPGIERSLRRGLASVAFQDSDVERLLAQLHRYYRQQLGEIAPAPAEAAAQAASLPIPDSVQPLAEDPDRADEDDTHGLPAEASAQLERVYALRPGTWLEFTLRDGTPERAKLSWISPMSGRYLFVNRRGLKVADHSPHELAMALAGNRLRILDSNALFDRAMDAIVDRLSHPADGRPTDTE